MVHLWRSITKNKRHKGAVSNDQKEIIKKKKKTTEILELFRWVMPFYFSFHTRQLPTTVLVWHQSNEREYNKTIKMELKKTFSIFKKTWHLRCKITFSKTLSIFRQSVWHSHSKAHLLSGLWLLWKVVAAKHAKILTASIRFLQFLQVFFFGSFSVHFHSQ